MTIRSHINARELNARLSLVETCAAEAPEGTYDHAKRVTNAIGDIAEYALSTLREAGLKVSGDDSLREVEAVIYGYVLRDNEEALATAEGFGEHVQGPARERVIANAARNRDFLRSVGVI